MLDTKLLDMLQKGKNLLAFSGGADSTALFFLLLEHKVDFDIAIVDYEIRAQSKEEVHYAQTLAHTHKLTCHLYKAPQIQKNFESQARTIRYTFFEELIAKYNYTNLITAHHLGDRFEWMLMQFCKGAGAIEIAGMQKEQKRQGYTLVRPLLDLDKQELLSYLHTNKILFFEDQSNLDTSIKRNEFRHNHALPLLQKYLRGIKKSFAYLDEDVNTLLTNKEIYEIDDFAFFHASQQPRSDIYLIDKYLKSKDYMLSAKERQHLKGADTFIVGRKFIIAWHNQYICIAPFEQEKRIMTKEFKEQMRLLKVATPLRPYLYKRPKVLAFFQQHPL